MHCRSLLNTLVFLSLLSLGLGHLHAGTLRTKHGASWRRRTERTQALDARNTTTLERRVDGARLTYYDAGQNACGGYDSDNDFVVALNAPQWDNGAHCYKPITIWYGGKSTQAKVTDMCPGCPYGGLDLSRGLFGFIADLGLGVVSASWVFDDDGSQQPQADLQAAAYTPYTSYSPADSPSTTHWTPTSKYTPATTYYAPETYASYSRFSTATAASSAHSSVSGGSTGSMNSATPSTTATAARTVDFDKGTLNQFNMALVGLSGLAEAAAWA